jgi:hypothetical protein
MQAKFNSILKNIKMQGKNIIYVRKWFNQNFILQHMKTKVMTIKCTQN